MMKKLKIGIVGSGAIGGSLARVIVKDFSRLADLVALYDIDLVKSDKLSKLISKKSLTVKNLNQLIQKSDLVIEAASAKISWDIARQALNKRRDVMIMSVGGLVDYLNELRVLAVKNNRRVYIPSGAISGVDAVKAANIGKIKEVTLTTTKNPAAFKGVVYAEKIGLNYIKSDKVLFSGSAKEAVKYFPQNINVAAVLSLAGIGKARTKVKIIASPKVKNNIHEIKVVSDSGIIFTRTENVLHPDNPKTSFLAVLSAVATLRQILEPVKIGS